ncbi:MAG: hypothetical protein OdinLCB4_003205 [Candidatus Odinarchaeum yellowstonii]|uniref:Uncharacterized protein n=1 Tax=Odinarchaeota yellowstonii (strain LCB_4) TaxID=1841599 RepID=A0AAF0IC13_ODILC|nr:MAG: hypothetical protein OdinLCB4_003205 [Candidatus Odinarchaeum yellowstonii]
MDQFTESIIGRLRALLYMLTSKLFMIEFEEYRNFLSGSVKQLIALCKGLRTHIEKNIVEGYDKLLKSLDIIERQLVDYSNTIEDQNIQSEEVYNISSDRINQIISASNELIQLFRKIQDYNLVIEEVYFLKNRLSESQRFEKTILPVLKNIKGRLSEAENKVIELTKQLDISEKKIFEIQAELSKLAEERDSLQERIQEILAKDNTTDNIQFNMETLASLKSENILLKQQIKELQDKLTQGSDKSIGEELNFSKEKIEELTRQLEDTKSKYLERISQLVEERNVWRSRALQTSVMNIEEALALLKNQINEFEKQNRMLIEENNMLRKELEKLKEPGSKGS